MLGSGRVRVWFACLMLERLPRIWMNILFSLTGGNIWGLWGNEIVGCTLMKLTELRLNTRSCSIIVPFLLVAVPPPVLPLVPDVEAPLI